MAEKLFNKIQRFNDSFWSLKRKEAMNGYLFLLPWIIGTLLFFAYPVTNSIQISFSKIIEYSSNTMEWVGLEHYTRALTSDATYLGSYISNIENMLKTIPFVNVFSLFIAVLLNRKFKGRAVFRAIFFLPVILGSGFAMSQLMNQYVDREAMEVVKEVLIPREVAIYIGAEATAAISVFLNLVSTIMWKCGVPIVIYLAALQGVPSSLYEAARVDAASEWEMFWLITLPLITPNMLLNMVYTVIDSFNDSQNWLLRYIHRISFTGRFEFEYSAAMAWLFFIWVIVIVAVIFLIMRPFVNRAKDR